MKTQTLSGFSRLLSIFQMPNHQSCKNYFWSAKYYIRTCRVGDVSYKDVCVCTFHLGVCGFIGGVLCVLNCFSRVWLFVTPMDRCPPGFSVCEILQARILEWVAMPSSRGSSWPRDQAPISCISYIAGGFFIASTTWDTPLKDKSPFKRNFITLGLLSYNKDLFLCCLVQRS